MAYSIQTAVSDGTLEVLDLSIKYMDKSHIFVYVDDVLVDGSAYSYVWLTDGRIQVVPAVASGSTLKVIRKTLTDEMWNEFSKGARFSTTSMDENFEQLLFLAQEYSEGIYVSDFYTDIDIHLQRILNLGDPINDGDAVNLKTLKEYLPNADLIPPLVERIEAEEANSTRLSKQGIPSATKLITGFDATGLTDGSWVHFAGRDTVGDGFGGMLRFLAGSTITPSGDMVYAVTGGRLVRDLYSSAFISYTPNGTGAIQRTVDGKLQEFISLADFGGKGDWNGTTGTDNTAAMNQALAACEASGFPLYVGPGRFYFAGLVTKAQSFTCPTIFGAGKAFTEFVFGGAVGFKIKGGSGTLCGAEVFGIKFSATSTATKLVQVADQCGLTFRKCGFGKGAIGLELVNESAGCFTEFVIADDCDFEEACAEALVYTRIDGTDSFHGSGLSDNCTINESATETKSKIRIGGTGSSTNDIIVYNAPMSFQIWKRTTLPVIDNNTTRFATNFHGNITLELFDAAGSGGKWPFADDAQKTYFVGGMSSLQDKTLRGSLVLCDTFETRADGTVSALLKPYRAESVPMVSGANTICTLPTVTTETYLVTVRFADSAGPARKVYLLAVNFDSAGTHTVTTIAQLEDYFGGNMPYPTFSVSGSSLIATAAFATTVSAYATISKIGIGDGFGF